MKTETVQYILPDFWACPLINDDCTGLSDEDEKALDAWLEKNRPGYCVNVDDDRQFMWYHDARPYVLACDCCTFTFHKPIED